jgi:hypothetical protein
MGTSENVEKKLIFVQLSWHSHAISIMIKYCVLNFCLQASGAHLGYIIIVDIRPCGRHAND